MSIEILEHEARRAFAFLGDEPQNWVPQTNGVDHDVVVVGAGQSGVAVAASLRRAGVHNVIIFDDSEPDAPGMWRDKAYMSTLRTPKANIGPEIGIPNLSYRSWFEAQFGEDAYSAIELIDRISWDNYLRWLRRLLGVEIRFQTKLTSVKGVGTALDLSLDTPGGHRTIRTRKLVLATGVAGIGKPDIPDVIRKGLRPDRYAHAYSVLDASKVANSRVAILGAGSSAFDAAAFALENGADEVKLFCRAEDLPRSTSLRAISYPAIEHFHLLQDRDKWSIAQLIKARGSVPTAASIARVKGFDNFGIYLSSPWDAVSEEDGSILIRTPNSSFSFDFVILGTGFRIDPQLPPELSEIASEIAIWRDRFDLPANERDANLGCYPYLGSGYRFLARNPDRSRFVENIHCFNAAALPSFGRLLGDVASLRTGVPRLVEAISSDLFSADEALHVARFSATPPDDLTGEEYRLLVRDPVNEKGDSVSTMGGD
ncbi:SidA/IucD/PvdA family monooxygenase [Paraburkholderia sp. RL17-347-BIC-D]|uniref:SidA/IucD/PvdA family monooxygenase n=1 Tax=Paraburkholderia sp. RL17-347-BIC-D TaxID=3031632 RepID=UPI0038BE0793